MRRSSLVRRVAAASATVLALTVLAACSDDEPEPDTATETNEPAPSPTETAPGPGDEVDAAAFVSDVLGGLTDATTAHVTVEMQGGRMTIAAEGDLDYSSSPPSMSMTMTNRLFGPGKFEVRLVDGVMYLNVDRFASGKWVRYDPDGATPPEIGDLVDQLNPGAGLSMVEDAVTTVTFVGDEVVDDETLHHYTMEVRTEAARGLIEKYGGDADVDVPSVLTFDVWVDDEDLLRRSEVSLGEVGSIATTLSGWGEPVDIEAPAEEDILDLPGGPGGDS